MVNHSGSEGSHSSTGSPGFLINFIDDKVVIEEVPLFPVQSTLKSKCQGDLSREALRGERTESLLRASGVASLKRGFTPLVVGGRIVRPDEERWSYTRDEEAGTETRGRARLTRRRAMVRPWDEGQVGSEKVRSPDPDGDESSGVLPLGGKPRGGTKVYEGNALWNRDLNKAYLIYNKKRLRKNGKLFQEKEEASLYTRILTLLINPDNATGKQETRSENETRKEQAKNGDRDAQENRNGKQKRGKTKIAEHTPTRNRTEAERNETGDRARTD
ncbi:hypothetical protein DFP73DRAFT_591421 [Morchella snyderi]|nr:hypothetical protein DFP73DRAFT_591421 [Morchella snyderi]